MQALFHKNFPFSHSSSRPPAMASPTAAGSSHKLPPLRTITHARTVARDSAAQPPIQRHRASPAAGPAAQAAARYSARPPSRGRTGSRLNAHSTRWAPAAAGYPGQGKPCQQVRQRTRQHRRQLPAIGQPPALRRQLRSEHADPQGRDRPAQQPQRRQVPQLVEGRGGQDQPRQMPAVHHGEPPHQQAGARGHPHLHLTQGPHSRWGSSTAPPGAAPGAGGAPWPRRSGLPPRWSLPPSPPGRRRR